MLRGFSLYYAHLAISLISLYLIAYRSLQGSTTFFTFIMFDRFVGSFLHYTRMNNKLNLF